MKKLQLTTLCEEASGFIAIKQTWHTYFNWFMHPVARVSINK
jgi:hypothetical protein